MSSDDLLRVMLDRNSLVPEAAYALGHECAKRGLDESGAMTYQQETGREQPQGESRFKKVGVYTLGLAVMLGSLLAAVWLVWGMVWVSEKALPWLLDGSLIALSICIFILLPLCMFRRTRPWAGVGLYIASFLFGAMLLAYSCLFVVYVWGYGGLAVGLVFAGVGVVPVALLAALLHAEWISLLEMLFGIFLTFGARLLGLRLAARL